MVACLKWKIRAHKAVLSPKLTVGGFLLLSIALGISTLFSTLGVMAQSVCCCLYTAHARTKNAPAPNTMKAVMTLSMTPSPSSS